MKLKPIFTSTASGVTIEGDSCIPAPSSYGSVRLQWKLNGILVMNEASYPMMLSEEGQLISVGSQSIIPWPEAGADKTMLVTTQDGSREIFSIHLFWTADAERWKTFKRALKNKGDCYLSELSDKYRYVMGLSNGPLNEETLSIVRHLLDELKSMYKDGYISEVIYDKVKHDLKSEMYPYCVRMIQKQDVSAGLLQQCSVFVKQQN